MLNGSFDSIDKSRLESLVANEVKESRVLEFKEALPGNGREDRKEFLADVSSFANAGGGDILFGIRERREGGKTTGVAEAVVGLPGLNSDAVIRQLESIIQDGIEPRLSVQMKTVEGFEAGPVLVLRIPRSFSAPHMVKSGDSRFYSRTNAGKQPLDVSQIRSAFEVAGSLPEKIRRFRDERISRIVANETPLSLPDRPKVVVHLMPFASLDATTQVDFRRSWTNEYLEPLNAGGWSRRHNLDGFITYSSDGTPRVPVSYLQLFRSGAVEAVETQIIDPRDFGQGEREVLPSAVFEREVINGVTRYTKLIEEFGIETPIVIMVSVTGVKGCELAISKRGFDSPALFDRDVLLLPDVLIADFSTPSDVVLQPVLDALWQAAGVEGCRHYRDGRWFWPA
jgi:hypothetical protein